ncbi:MAG: GNAT family N-acetyltransferase [Deltaproteobacteria bacterium]|nr:GNAT family N-acetyltransferase [Deltaproteobacteria bacterium]
MSPKKAPGDFHAALALREVVFIEEQAVPPDLERDEFDQDAFHVLAWEGMHPVGTGRLVELSAPPEGCTGKWGRIGRMAVVSYSRGKGIGRMILEALEAEARTREMTGIKLHAQIHAMGFYEAMGYVRCGEEFEEAGIPHCEARKEL